MAQTHEDITELVRTLVTSLVDDTDAVSIESSDQENGDLHIDVTVAADEVGKVIGRQGRVIKALRTLARAAASQADFGVDVEVLG